MPTIYDTDYEKYVEDEDLRTMRKYEGAAIYLPRGEGFVDLNSEDTEGGSFLSALGSIGKFIGNNAGTIGNVAGAVGKIAELGVSIAKGVEEVNSIKALRAKALEANPDKLAYAVLAPRSHTNNLTNTSPAAPPEAPSAVAPETVTTAETTASEPTTSDKKPWYKKLFSGSGISDSPYDKYSVSDLCRKSSKSSISPVAKKIIEKESLTGRGFNFASA